MVAADHDRRLDLALGHELVEEQAGLVALAVAQPADAGRQALELHELGGAVEPAVQVLVLGEQLLQGLVGHADVLRVAGERGPAERAEALAEQRADVGRDEARELERAGVAGLAGLVADGVAVVEHLGADVLEADHGLDLAGHGLLGLLGEGVRVGLGLGVPVLLVDLDRQVGQRVVRGGLVGDDVDLDGAGLLALEQLGEHLGGVAHEAHGDGLAVALGLHDALDGLVDVRLHLVQVALAHATAQAVLRDVHDQADAAVEGDGQGLGAAHAAAAAGEGEGALEGAVVALAADRGEGLVGALQDALGGDVDPRAGGHLAVHHQALGLELAELRPRGPVAHEVGVGDQHARGPLVGAEHAHRLAGLHQEGLVLLEVLEGGDDGVVGLPGAGRAAGAAVDDEVLGPLGDLGVQVVHEHPQRGLGLPGLGGQLGAARGADGAGRVVLGEAHGHGSSSRRGACAAGTSGPCDFTARHALSEH
ncbi:hypothetical protein GCM10022203_09960 [Micrococcus yunnanensis]